MDAEHAKAIAQMPEALRELVEAELAAGNEIVEVGHSFPAPPAGCYVKLAKTVSTRTRVSAGGIDFDERNSSSYSGEFSDPRRFFFVLEPPLPPPPEPDMNAIREAMNVSSAPAASALRDSGALVDRFRDSMVLNYERWHDGIGYDLDAIREAGPAECASIESLLVARALEDWRDVEALAALDTPGARKALRRALTEGGFDARLAVLSYAPHVATHEERVECLVHALHEAASPGLSRLLHLVEETHPPEVMDALLRGTLERDGTTAVHYAAMLFFLHGKAAEPFDWSHRPFFLTFNTDSPSARTAAFLELCDHLGLDPKAALRD